MARNHNIHSRFECKYLVDPATCAQIREFLSPFLQPDRYARGYPSYTYPICSLYLDSPDLLLYSQVLAGEKNRFKLRVRTYSDDPRAPVFLEVKRRMNQILQKTRAKLDRDTATTLLTDGARGIPAGLAGQLMPDVDEFTCYKMLLSARPVVRVRYMREAYEARTGEPVRVTFDTNLGYAPTFDATLSYAGPEFRETPVDGIILEIKFTDLFPPWARDMAEVFQLHQRSVPKYVMSVTRILDGARSHVVELAGFQPPLHRYRDV